MEESGTERLRRSEEYVRVFENDGVAVFRQPDERREPGASLENRPVRVGCRSAVGVTG